jgi:putative ABC transport system permease protein
MTGLRVFCSRLVDLVLRRRRGARLEEEIQAHLDLLADEFVARGLAPAEARLAARRAFGRVDQVKADYRDQQGLPVLDAMVQDVRFAGRLLRRDPSFAVIAICVLGLGIGVNNMLFTILYAHTIRGLPIPDAARVVSISTIDDKGADRGLSYPDFVDLRDGAQRFASLAAFASAPVVIAGDGRAPERFEGAYTSAGAFPLLRIQPLTGRAFSSEDDGPAGGAVMLLGSAAWKTRYGSDPAIVGKSLLVNGVPATVIGVISDRSGFPGTAEVWLPLSRMPGLAAAPRDARTLRVIGRVGDGHSVADAGAEAEAIAGRLSRDHPSTNRNVRMRVVPINERYLGRLTDPTWLAFMTVGFLVVFIACANVANLLLGRGVHRAREIAIRTSLGATRGRLVRQLVIEGFVLAALAGGFGLLFAMAAVRLFAAAIPENTLPYWLAYTIDSRILLALVGVSAGTVLVFALVPAINASKTDAHGVLRDGHRAGASSAARRWTTVFVTAEIALAVVLLSHLAVNIRTARPALPAEGGLDTTDVITAALTLPAGSYRTPADRVDFYRRLDERLGAVPEVASFSIVTAAPFSGGEEKNLISGPRGDTDPRSLPSVWIVAVSPRYFETLGLALLRGRDFNPGDGRPGQTNAIVNERFVERFLRDRDPLGQRFSVTSRQAPQTPPEEHTIVGVAPSMRQRPARDPDPVVFVPMLASPPLSATLLARGRTSTQDLGDQLRREVQVLDPMLPLYRMRALRRVVSDAQWNGRLSNSLFLFLTFIAVSLATVGLYGVIAHGVSQRTHEIGVRMALGAQPRHMVSMIVRHALTRVGAGFTGGIVCTFLWASMFASGRADVNATDARSFAIVAGALALLAVLACAVPARRAAHLDPVAAIRHE